MEHRATHPLDIDLLSYALGESAAEVNADITSHLGECLLCRIQLGRIRRNDLDLGPEPGQQLRFPTIAPEVIAVVEGTSRPERVEAGQVWFAGSSRRVAVWIDHADVPAGFAV